MINKVILVGRITKDIEVRKAGENSVCSFSLAVNRRKSKNTNGQEADFINCVAWNQVADLMGNYLHKGSQIGVVGRIQTRNYDDKNGKKVYVTEVLVENVVFLDTKNEKIENQDFVEEEPVAQTFNIVSDDLPF